MQKRRALLIVDLQQGFHPSAALVQKISKKLEQHPIVVATQFLNGNTLFQNVLGMRKAQKGDTKLPPLPRHVKVFQKTGYGPPPALIQFLKFKKIARVDVAGVDTDACVLASMFTLWDSGIEPRLLRNLTETKNKKRQQAAHLIAKRNFGS